MSPRPTPAPLRRAFALAWLMSQAFTKHQPGAILAYPVCLLTVGIYLPRRQVYETDDGTGGSADGSPTGGTPLLFVRGATDRDPVVGSSASSLALLSGLSFLVTLLLSTLNEVSKSHKIGVEARAPSLCE